MLIQRLCLVLASSMGVSGCSTTLFQADFDSDWPSNIFAGGPPGDPVGDSVHLDPRGGASTSVVDAYGVVFLTNDDEVNNRAFFYSAYFDKSTTNKRIHWKGEAEVNGSPFFCWVTGGDSNDTHRPPALRITVKNDHVYCSKSDGSEIEVGELTSLAFKGGRPHEITILYRPDTDTYSMQLGQPGQSGFKTCNEGAIPGGVSNLEQGPRIIVGCGFLDYSLRSEYYIAEMTIKEK